MKIFGESVVVVPSCWLAGFTEPSPVVRDNAMPGIQKYRNLLLPRGSAQRISVDKDNRITRAMIFVIQFDVGGVFFRDINVWR